MNLSNVFLVQLPNFSLSFSFIPVAPVITGIIVHFRFHIHCISIRKILYFNCNFIIIIIIIIIIIYLLQLKFHPVAVVLTLVQTKQIRYKIYINKTIQKKNIVATIQNTVNKSTNTSKYKYTYHYKCLYSTHYSKHPHNCQNTHTLQNKLKQPQYKTHTHQILSYSVRLGIMLPKREADYSCSFSGEFNNEYNHISTFKCLHVYKRIILSLLLCNKCWI